MRQISAAIVTALVLVGAVAVVPAAGLGQSGETSATAAAGQATNQSNASITPGERLSGVLGVQEAELQGEVESRSFGLAVARAESDEARAALIAQQVNETRERVEDLRERREALREARSNGSISDGEYRARIAELAARGQNVERSANQTGNASEGLPADLLESKGINASAIRTLQTSAANLTGPEVAEIARSIAGDVPERAERGQAAERGTDEPDERERGPSTPTERQTDGATEDGTTATADGVTTTDETEDGTTATADGVTTTDETEDGTTTDGSDAGGSAGGADRR